MPAGMRIPGKPRSDRELLRPTICTGTVALALVLDKKRNGRKNKRHSPGDRENVLKSEMECATGIEEV